MTKLVFVYGTLRKGHGNHRLLARGNAEFLGTRKTLPCYTLFSLGAIPAMDHGESVVTGEVYRVDRRTLRSLDLLEGHPQVYRREPIKVEGFLTQHIESYLMNEGCRGKRCEVIDSGDFNEYKPKWEREHAWRPVPRRERETIHTIDWDLLSNDEWDALARAYMRGLE